MTRKTYTIEIITPCFCAGAHADQAEIRAPAIRGQLRWWFRVLGGSAADESAIFGTSAGDTGHGSAVRVAVAGFTAGRPWHPPDVSPNTPQSYIWHYARESGKTPDSGRHVAGPRWQARGALPPGSRFQLQITWLRSLSPNLLQAFDRALNAFLCFGTLGLRATRGLGAFHCGQAADWREMLAAIQQAGFRTALRQQPEHFSSWESALQDWSAWLRFDLRKRHKAASYSALGCITPRRQTSAVRFRPIKLPEIGMFTWLALEAPHGRVLDPRLKAENILTPTIFTGPSPTPPQRPPR